MKGKNLKNFSWTLGLLMLAGTMHEPSPWKTLPVSSLYFPLPDPSLRFLYGFTEEGTIVRLPLTRDTGVISDTPGAPEFLQYARPDFGSPTQLMWLKPGSQLMVFYPEAQKVVFLSEELSELYVLDLRTLPGNGHYTALARGPGRSLWLYDSRRHEVILYNYALRQVVRSARLPEQLGFFPDVVQMFSVGNLIFLSDTGRRVVFVFNGRGFLLRRIQEKTFRFTQPLPESLVLHGSGELLLLQVQGSVLSYEKRIRYPFYACHPAGTWWSPHLEVFYCGDQVRYRKKTE